MNINIEFPMLRDFKMRYFNGATYSSTQKQGSMISEGIYDPLLNVTNVTVIMFNIVDDFISKFYPTARLDFSMKEDILQQKISDDDYLWFLLSNNTLIIYQRVQNPIYNPGDSSQYPFLLKPINDIDFNYERYYN